MAVSIIFTIFVIEKENNMKTTVNNWFKGLDSFTLSFIFSGLYSEIMESADPKRCTVNCFVKEAREKWNGLSEEDKEKIYNQYKDA